MKRLCFLCFILIASVLSAQQVTDTHQNPVVKLVDHLDMGDELEHHMSGMSFSQDGKHIYTGGGWEDGRLFRWPYPVVKGQKGEELFEAVYSRTAALNSIVCSPDGKYVAVAGRELYVFTKTSHNKIWRYITSQSAFTSDSQMLLAASGYDLIAWEIKSGQFIVKYHVGYEDCRSFNSLCLSVDNQYVYLGTRDGVIIQARLRDGEEVNRFKEHNCGICDLVCTKNLLVSAGGDAKVLIWKINPEGQSLTPIRIYSPNTDESTQSDGDYDDIEISPNGQWVVFSSREILKEETPPNAYEQYVCRIVFWSFESDAVVHEIVTPEAHDAALSFHPQETILAVKGKGKILFFDYSGLIKK